MSPKLPAETAVRDRYAECVEHEAPTARAQEVDDLWGLIGHLVIYILQK